MCENYQEKISLYIDKLLSIDEEKALLSHIETCDDCKKSLEILTNIVSELNTLEKIEPPAELHNEIMAKIKVLNDKKHNNKIINFNFKKLSTIAAAFLFSTFTISALLNSFNIMKSSSNSQDTTTPIMYSQSSMKVDEENIEENNVSEDISTFAAPETFATGRGMLASAYDTTRYVEKHTYVQIESDDIDTIKAMLMDKYAINHLSATSNAYNNNLYMEILTDIDNYSSVLEEIKSLGTVNSIRIDENDCTNEIIALNSQLDEKRTQSQRYLDLMSNSNNVEELAFLNNSVSDLENNITRITNQINTLHYNYNNPVITLSVDSTATYDHIDDTSLSTKIKNAFITSFNYTTNFFTVLSVLFAYLLIPCLIIIVIIVFVIKLVLKKRGGNYEK